MKHLLVSIALLFFSSWAFASGSVTCESTHAPEKFSISWGTMHGIGSPQFGHFTIDWGGKKYALGVEAKKTEVGTTALPVRVVGYWVDGSDRLLLKITDDQVLETLVHIDAISTKVGSETLLQGDAYLKLTKAMPSRKLSVRCSLE